MAELDTSGGGGKKGGKVRSKKQSTRVDLTAMVDLAFLLVTFFMLTTTLNKPKAMDLAMPDKDDQNTQEPIAASRTMTVLLGSNNKLEWFIGEPGKSAPEVIGYGKNDLRKVLTEQKQKVLQTTGKSLFVIVKPSDKSVYKNVVDVLDELHITDNMAFAIVAITPPEVDLLKRDNIY
ncbi:biopolymer transporter ExbD [Mucilaginibacter daejeonensis]|uniref:ExbD/TolR family protein n=1 Tax=Mucilaginibacter daejeonensis TaxID=398049 RepID=UPI001D17258D|nr:biopolymer transporter ExbD [Mucilaginibacter daejeonensis]UEG52918.1 biopolymer transporter ExbD [Mucilaginibacter daejeonensis]